MEPVSLWGRITSGNLILQIFIGIVAAVLLVVVDRDTAAGAILLGNLFVGALKAVAPVLVLVLVASALANQRATHTSQMRPIVMLYLVGTFSAALLAVVMSKVFPTTLTLVATATDLSPPQGIAEVLNTLLFKIVDNPV
ncbi:MAG: cation:dicarboxylase symporter family transporter, partial [Woeseiaceae bacterium]|nr:cation:dicarboxylase symporter family transporter [Woeseiaceae bacterium]